jgi:Ala-tRNA(Pro) deacylase
MVDFFNYLAEHGIAYERHDHPAVHTIEEADRLVPTLPAAKTKNLFLRDSKGSRHFLVIVSGDKQMDIKGLQTALGTSRLSFGSPKRLKKYLGIEPGAVSLFAIVNDTEQKVEVIVDKAIWSASAFQFHPLVNTSTLVVSNEGVHRFLESTGHTLQVIEVPEREG